MTARPMSEEEREIERLSEINRQLVEEYNTLLLELVRRDNKASELSAKLISTSASERGLREALEIAAPHFFAHMQARRDEDAGKLAEDRWGLNAREEDQLKKVRAAFSPKGEDTQARSPSVHSAPTHTSTKDTTNA